MAGDSEMLLYLTCKNFEEERLLEAASAEAARHFGAAATSLWALKPAQDAKTIKISHCRCTMPSQ